MKEMMFSPNDFELVADYVSGKNCLLRGNSFCEPNSVLDSRIPSGLTSPSTLSSSLGGGSSGSGGGGAASTDTAEVAAAVSGKNHYCKWQQDSTTATSSTIGGVESELLQILPSLDIAVSGGGARAEKCAMKDWESVLSESASASPFHEQSISRWNMGDVVDPAINEIPNKSLQFGAAAASTVAEFGFSGGFGVVDQAFTGANHGANFFNNSRSSYEMIDSAANHFSTNTIKFHQNSQNLIYPDSSSELKLNPQLLIHHHQPQPFFSPSLSYGEEQEQTAPPPPSAKRLNSGSSFLEARQQLNQQHLQLLHYPHHRPKMNGVDHQQQIIDHLYKAAGLLQTGNPSLAQEILARLNHHLSPIGNPFQRSAFYSKEALQLLLHSTTTPTTTSTASLVLKIDAYKSFSEISPLINFANFITNQALLEFLSGYSQIHIVDFDIGYGGQWASLMQELALTSSGATVLKITALVSPGTHNHLELTLTRENLTQFASEMNIGFEFNILSIESIRSLPLHPTENEAVAVNIPIGCLTNYQLSAPLALRLVKQLSPKIVVSVNRACDRPDLPFPNHIIHTLEYYSSVLESLDAVNVNVDTLQKIERFLIQPGMEKLVMRRFCAPENSYEWRSLFVSCGLSPGLISNSTVSLAEYIVKRMGVGGFEVEKRQSSLVLCWQRKELLSASIWRC